MAESQRRLILPESAPTESGWRRGVSPTPGGSQPANDNWPRPANDNQPRPTSSMSRVALGAIARLLPRLHPYMRAWDAYLLLRELAEQMQGQGTAVRPHIVPGAATTPDGEYSWTSPDGWVFTWGPGFSTAEALGGTPYVTFNAGLYGQYFGASSQGGDLTVDAAVINATRGVGAGTNHAMWGPLVEFTPFDKRRQYRGNATEPSGWAPGQPVPSPVMEVGATWLVWSPVGLGAPNALSAPRDALQRLQLPGQYPGGRNLRWGAVQALQAVRQELQLSERVEEVVPGRIEFTDPWLDPLTSPAAQPRPDSWPAQRWPEYRDWFPVRWLSGEYEGGPKGKWRPGPKVRYRPLPSSEGRERKLKFRRRTGAWMNSALGKAQGAFSAVTETMDLVESIWEALPRSSRTAGTTPTGNRRLDSMLRDLRRDWDKIDWREAMDNVQWNALEDLAYGSLSMLATAGTSATGFGGGLVGGGVIMPGNTGFYQSRDTGAVSYANHPVGRLLDAMRGQLEATYAGTERDTSDRIRRLQDAGIYPEVPQARAQNWFDTRTVDGFPWVVLRPGQSLDPAPPSPYSPHERAGYQEGKAGVFQRKKKQGNRRKGRAAKWKGFKGYGVSPLF